MIVSNETNLAPLATAIQNARSSIIICSAWIRSETLAKIFSPEIKNKIRTGAIKLQMVLRLGKIDDVEITDEGVFRFIEEMNGNAELRYHRSLHAKLFLVDGTWGMLGSFNLTGGGFGDASRPGSNPEAGVIIEDEAELQGLCERFSQIWAQSTEITKGLLGFVLDQPTHSRCAIAGVTELPVNTFVEIRDGDQRVIGQVVNSIRHSEQWAADLQGEGDPAGRARLFDGFGVSTNLSGASTGDLGASARALAISGLPDRQVRIAEIQIITRLVRRNDAWVPTWNPLPPSITAPVYSADPTVLGRLYAPHGWVCPAVMIENRDIAVGIDPEKLLTMHGAVFGSTGSGKSYFTKLLLREHLMPALVQSRIIVFDPHGEYAKDLGSSNGVTIIDAGSIPEFGCRLVRDADELEAVLDMKMERTARTIVDQAIRQAKGDRQAFLAYLKDHAVRHAEGESFDPEEFAAVRDDIKTNITAFFKTLQDTADKVVNAERQADLMDAANSDEATKRTKQIKQEIEAEIVERVDRWFGGLPQATKDHLTDKITRSVFFKNVETYFGDEVVLIAPAVLEAIEEVIDTINLKPLDLVSRMQKPGVYIINLQKIHEEEVRHDLAHSILRQVFEAKKSDPEKEMDSLFVVEEAHNFAPEGASKNNPASRMLKKIASEGRKFRLGLLVVTQRPAYVSKDVLSQCSTQFVFRLINPNDIKAVAETVEGISEAQLKELPGFETGQAIFTGVAVQSSVMVRVK